MQLSATCFVRSQGGLASVTEQDERVKSFGYTKNRDKGSVFCWMFHFFWGVLADLANGDQGFGTIASGDE